MTAPAAAVEGGAAGGVRQRNCHHQRGVRRVCSTATDAVTATVTNHSHRRSHSHSALSTRDTASPTSSTAPPRHAASERTQQETTPGLQMPPECLQQAARQAALPAPHSRHPGAPGPETRLSTGLAWVALLRPASRGTGSPSLQHPAAGSNSGTSQRAPHPVCVCGSAPSAEPQRCGGTRRRGSPACATGAVWSA